MKKLWLWLVMSSEDPTKVALTVKGFLGTVGSVVILLSPLVHLKVGTQQITDAVDIGVQMFTAFLGFVSLGTTLFGLGRKFYNTFKNPQI